jgi:hypothetical protein
MFDVEKNEATGGATLTARDGTVVEVPADVLVKLQDSDAIFSEWKRFLQAFSLQNMDHARALKTECATDAEYRSLRSKLRLL